VLVTLACSSRPGVQTGGGGTDGAAGSSGVAGSGIAGSPGLAGSTGVGGSTGLAGSTGLEGSAGTRGGDLAAMFDVCTCACTCADGGGTARDTPCRPRAGELCTCDMLCGNACAKSGLGALVSATGSCAHTAVPVLWSCPLTGYGTGDGCTCGCGAQDPDCGGTTAGSCRLCNANGSCATNCTQISPTDGTTCTDIPATWRCSPGFFGRGDGCDCGCGAVDPDCVDATQAACEFCGNPGSCAVTQCDDISATDNGTCR